MICTSSLTMQQKINMVDFQDFPPFPVHLTMAGDDQKPVWSSFPQILILDQTDLNREFYIWNQHHG